MGLTIEYFFVRPYNDRTSDIFEGQGNTIRSNKMNILVRQFSICITKKVKKYCFWFTFLNEIPFNVRVLPRKELDYLCKDLPLQK